MRFCSLVLFAKCYDYALRNMKKQVDILTRMATFCILV